MNLKQFIPKILKVQYQLLKRYWQDVKMNYQFALSKGKSEKVKYQVELTQPIKPSHLYLNKVHNLELGGNRIGQVQILPNEVFSFWKVIQQPNKKNGFKKGRNIIGNKLLEDFGGGLCQLSGIIYHLSLLVNLDIVERHNHSQDIYTEETRYSPLGCDATVVFAYKDLRVRNNSKGIIQFEFKITNEKITVILKSEYPLEITELTFDIKEQKNQKIVYVYDENGMFVSKSIYILNH